MMKTKNKWLTLPVLGLLGATLALTLLAGSLPASATGYFNGFETDITGWETPTRVASGTDGIPSSTGGWHATTAAGAGDFTRWGGYNYGAGSAVPTVFHEYFTSVDIYLNVAGGWANDTRFDFDSAISDAAGNFRRDFIFNAGFYNDTDGSPGSGTARFVISASNNSQPGSAFAKNPGRGPIAISTTGWYTFQHHFYNLAGVLAVDLSILDSSGTLVHSWTLSDATDLITVIGGNRYGWFDYNQFSTLAFDNTIRADNLPDSECAIISNIQPTLVAVNTAFTLTANVNDTTTGNNSIISATYSIDGGVPVPMTASDGAFDEANEDVKASVAAFPLTGVYTVCVSATDSAGNSCQECILLAVYDPNGGFVTGGGWINSPLGAYVADPTLTDKATFGFVSQYKKGASIPTGSTEFQFNVGDLNFHSEVYQWLVVSGPKAQYKGTGQINNAGNYGFLLTATDGQVTGGGGVDKFRIKIWDNNDSGVIVYDNVGGGSDDIDLANPQAIGGGSIVIHKK